MKRVLRGLLSIGSPREAADSQWQEILQVRGKLQELERRMRLSEQCRCTLRPPTLVGTWMARLTGEDSGS